MKTYQRTLILCLALLSFLSARSGRDVLELSRKRTTLPGLEAQVDLIITDSRGNERKRQIAMGSRQFAGDIEKRIILFRQPADVAGMGMLIEDHPFKDDAMWIYLPVKKSARRMVSSEKSRSFMGSEFSNADMSAPNLDDFDCVLIKQEILNDTVCYVVSQTPRNDKLKQDYGFSRSVSWIDTLTYLPVKRDYYDLRGEKEKTLFVQESRCLDTEKKLYLLTRLHMENGKNGRSSRMRMTQIRLAPDLPGELFTVTYLENAQ